MVFLFLAAVPDLADQAYADSLRTLMRSRAGTRLRARLCLALGKLGDKQAVDPITKFTKSLGHHYYSVPDRQLAYQGLFLLDPQRAYPMDIRTERLRRYAGLRCHFSMKALTSIPSDRIDGVSIQPVSILGKEEHDDGEKETTHLVLTSRWGAG